MLPVLISKQMSCLIHEQDDAGWDILEARVVQTQNVFYMRHFYGIKTFCLLILKDYEEALIASSKISAEEPGSEDISRRALYAFVTCLSNLYKLLKDPNDHEKGKRLDMVEANLKKLSYHASLSSINFGHLYDVACAIKMRIESGPLEDIRTKFEGKSFQASLLSKQNKQ